MSKKKNKKYPNIGARFRALREELDTIEHDCTQDVLAKIIYISKPQISELENGKRLPSINELKMYHRHFNVPMEYLLGEQDCKDYDYLKQSVETGLSDKAQKKLKMLKKSMPNYNHILNYLIESNHLGKLLQVLHNYFFFEFNYPQMCKITGGEIANISINVGNLDFGNYMLRVDDLMNIHKQIIYNTLTEIKNELKEKGFDLPESFKTKENINCVVSRDLIRENIKIETPKIENPKLLKKLLPEKRKVKSKKIKRNIFISLLTYKICKARLHRRFHF